MTHYPIRYRVMFCTLRHFILSKCFRIDRGCLIIASRSHWEEQKLSPHPFKAQNPERPPSDQKIKEPEVLLLVGRAPFLHPDLVGSREEETQSRKTKGGSLIKGKSREEKSFAWSKEKR